MDIEREKMRAMIMMRIIFLMALLLLVSVMGCDGRDDENDSFSAPLLFTRYIQKHLDNTWISQLSGESAENYKRSILYQQSQMMSLQESHYHEYNTMLNKNRTKRPIYNGHYVKVEPLGLQEPKIILVSHDVAQNLLGLSPDHYGDSSTPKSQSSFDFVQWVSGNIVITSSPRTENDEHHSNKRSGWSTPYALSIMGNRYTSNCPFGTGDGYGDGRAISIAELTIPMQSLNGQRYPENNSNNSSKLSSLPSSSSLQHYEIQLKGAGPTPFSRGADGRAVLRSSIREFLASEAMHYLGIRTTRALALVQSSEQVERPWYQGDQGIYGTKDIPTSLEDPRLALYPVSQRKAILKNLRNRKEDPNIKILEKCAITSRVASSFIRIGHFDLYARRAVQMLTQQQEKKYHDDDTRATTADKWKELTDMVWHTCYREFRNEAYEPFYGNSDIGGAASKLLEMSAERLGEMVSQWIRVGFAQGNFNADNCHVAGLTIDYGPFGWMEEYNPTFAKWTGSGSHFGFLNQPDAALKNYEILVESIVPVILLAKNHLSSTTDTITKLMKEEQDKLAEQYLINAQHIFQRKQKEIFRLKLGLSRDNAIGDELWKELAVLMSETRVDWTLFWRQLSYVADDFIDNYHGGNEERKFLNTRERMLEALMRHPQSMSNPFYEALEPVHHQQYLDWMQKWKDAVDAEEAKRVLTNARTINEINNAIPAIGERMKLVNPKYVLREWMLVDAYTAANDGDYSVLRELYNLIQNPYDEGSMEEQKKYYVRAHDEVLTAGGIAFMS